jgi:hypothetical protein
MTSDAKKIVKITGFSVFFIIIIVYAFFVSKDLIFGVKIKNVNLADGAIFTENIVKVTGNAKNAINLILNGREISINEQGDFEETIVLLPGYNIINLKAQDKFGRIDEKNYKLMYTQPKQGE